MDDALKRQLERDEGKRLEAYLDTNNFWTIGIGHLLGVEKRMSRITEEECTALLTVDVEEAAAGLNNVFGQSIRMIDAPRYRALVNMMFNRGEGAVRKSSTITPAIRQALDTHNWKPVHDAILASPWAAQIGKRAERLAKQFLTGVDQ